MDGTRTRKEEVIDYALKSCGILEHSQTVMVGDRKHDVLGATRFGIDTIGVLYGYGTREELEQAGAAYFAERPEDICQFVIP